MDSPPRLLVLPVAQGSKYERPPRGHELGFTELPTLNSRPAADPAFGRIGAYARPASRGRSAEACCNGAMLKAAYRFFTNDDIAPEDILQSHIEATYSRLNAVPIVWLSKIRPNQLDKFARDRRLGPTGHPACHGCWSIPRWPSRQSGSPWGSWRSRCGPDPNDIGKRARRKAVPSVRGESKSGSTVSIRFFTAHDCCPTSRLVQRW